MSSLSFLSRIPRPLAAAGAAVTLVTAGLFAPQAASAYHFDPTPPLSCIDAALPTLVAGGQAEEKKTGPQGPGYYARGSGNFLGSQPGISAAVAEVSPGVWKKVSACS